MSQKKVTEFFSNRKRGVESHHASKRLKVALEANLLNEATTADSTAYSKTVSVMPCQTKVQSTECIVVEKKKNTKPSVKVRSVDKQKTKVTAKRTTQMTKYLRNLSPSQKQETPEIRNEEDSQVKDSEQISTSFLDDHGASPASSPVKRLTPGAQTSSNSSDSVKRGRNNETISLEDVYKTPDKFDFSPYAAGSEKSGSRIQLSSARKKLNLHLSAGSPVFDFKGNISDEQTPVSSISTLGQKLLNESPGKIGRPSPNESPGKIGRPSLSESPGKIGKPSPNDSPGKIGRCSNLAELKEKLAEFSGKQIKAENVLQRARQALDKRNLEKLQIVESKVELTGSTVEPSQQSSMASTCQAPAYERHSSLAHAGPPTTFQLPYRYRILKDTFQSTDTIVSMLTNRSEICTFSKLKVAVQDMSKRSFELSHLGQIKTVYPTAYCFRQEKDLPMFGGKASGYQLTIEPVLNETIVVNNTDSRMIFTATKLLERKNTFLHNLVNLVKKYHKEFLKKLNLNVNEADIKRWHPKFKLDSVPDVEPSELPQAPYTKTFSTAQDVLDEVKDKLNPRIQKALETVANKSSSPIKSDSTVTVQSNLPNSGSGPEISQSSAEDVADRLNAFRGIPSSLLERVRAKQAQKLEREMMRSTEDTKRIEMLQRLPELTRILRTHFVTQKRPAVPLVDVIKTFTNSYKSTLGMVEAEHHVKLIAEVVPEWMSIVHVKSGSFVKIDRDVDLMSVHDKIQNLIKSL